MLFVFTASFKAHENSSLTSSMTDASTGLSPSGSNPISSGCLLTKITERGTTIITPTIANIIHEVLQVYLSMKTWVSGTKIKAPKETPTAVTAKAFPLFRTNHLEGGTDVVRAPGPLIPTKPITENKTISCHASRVYARPTMHDPVIMVEPARIHLAP